MINQIKEKLELTKRLTRFVMEKEACNAGLNLCDALEKIIEQSSNPLELEEIIKKELSKDRGTF